MSYGIGLPKTFWPATSLRDIAQQGRSNPTNGTTTFQKNPFPNLVMLIISSRNVFDPP